MARQLVYIAKIYPNADEDLDHFVNDLQKPESMHDLVGQHLSGRGLIHWSCWYDPWLMGCDLNPDDWNLDIKATAMGEGVWELSLTTGWHEILSSAQTTQYAEQTWLRWQLLQAYKAFESNNDAAQLFYGRSVRGASIGDSELLGNE